MPNVVLSGHHLTSSSYEHFRDVRMADRSFAVRKFFVQAEGFPSHQFELLNVGWSTLEPMRDKVLPALKSLPNKQASFIPPMECLPVPKIPEGTLWVYEVKLDGYRAIRVNPKQGKPTLFSGAHVGAKV